MCMYVGIAITTATLLNCSSHGGKRQILDGRVERLLPANDLAPLKEGAAWLKTRFCKMLGHVILGLVVHRSLVMFQPRRTTHEKQPPGGQCKADIGRVLQQTYSTRFSDFSLEILHFRGR